MPLIWLIRIVSIFSAGFIIFSTIPGSASMRAWSSLSPMRSGLCAFSARMRAAVPSARGKKLVFLRPRPLQRRAGLGLGHRDHRAGLAPHPGVVHLRLLGGADEGERLLAPGGGGLARRRHPLLRLGLPGTGVVDVDLGRRLLDVLRGELDRVVGARRLGGKLGVNLLAAELPVACDLGHPHLALAGDAGRLAAPLRRRLLLGDVRLARRARGLDLALLGDRRLFLFLGEEELAASWC